jgi:peptide/nickel transport system ATP-binding protein
VTALIEARDLRKAFPAGRADFLGRRASSLCAVDGVDISVGEDEVHGLVGESGCGKSTLGRLLLGLLEPDSGTVSFMGRDLAALARGRASPKEEGFFRSGMQVVFQNPYSSLNPRLTIGSTLREVLRVRSPGNDTAQRVEEALAEVGLPRDALRRYPRELSGGQLQRVGIARALLVRPRLLVADEPLSSLDLSVQAQILNLLASIREGRGLSMLLVSHDLRVVEQVSDRVSVMYLGRIVETGRAEEVFARASHPYTQALLASAPDVRRASQGGRALRGGHAKGVRAAVEAPDSPPSSGAPSPARRGCRFAPRCPFKMPRCAEEEPSLIETGQGRSSACWLAEK